MKYKVGDKVLIRQWDDMAEEYGVDINGYINTPVCVNDEMKAFCGTVVTIKYASDGTYVISEDSEEYYWLELTIERKAGENMSGIMVENNAKNVKVKTENMPNGQVRVIIETIPAGVPLKTLKPGSKFTVGDLVFRVLEQPKETTGVILDGFLYDNKNVRFGGTNDWKGSDIRKDLNGTFLKKLEAAVGAENIIEHAVDLTSDDALDTYGNCHDKVSLLTDRLYRRYRPYLMDKMPDWWWLANPYSTPVTGDSSYVRCVYGSGRLYYYFSQCACCCVRPFCIFNSSILVSCKDE